MVIDEEKIYEAVSFLMSVIDEPEGKRIIGEIFDLLADENDNIIHELPIIADLSGVLVTVIERGDDNEE